MRPTPFTTLAGAVLLGLLSVAVAHGQDEEMSTGVSPSSAARPAILSATNSSASVPVPDAYWSYSEHTGLLTAHITLMTIAWVFVLPIAVMISIARSRYTLAVQFLFLIVNGIGVFLSTIYNANTPDLYPNNAHHKLGWILTWTVSVQVVLGVIAVYAGKDDRGSFMRVSAAAMEEHTRRHKLSRQESYRFSNDSGQGTEPNTESLRSQSISSTHSDLPEARERIEEDDEEKGLIHGSKVDKFLKARIPGMLSRRVLNVFRFLYNAIDRTILILGFIGFTTGIITYSGFFMGREVFSGLAHWIKGGIFFWYGILTLGRWAGCFADIGWAWNIKPLQSRAVSAEFVESFLIFFYGISNVFLEHLNAWGKAWSAQDLEHISITVMFFGGGLCGMLIESNRIRDVLNAVKNSNTTGDLEATAEPKSYRTPMNPIPALVVLLLGLMMSAHHQESMVSTMVHSQWGTLLAGAAFTRAATYIIFYLAPPASIYPGRPPTELITAFCLMAGGMIFMSSAKDVITTMENYNLDAMFIFTVSMGVITFLMAWIILVIAIKGVAVRRENRGVAVFRD